LQSGNGSSFAAFGLTMERSQGFPAWGAELDR